MGQYSKPRPFYTRSGLLRYETQIQHRELGKYQTLRGDNPHVLEQMALARVRQWDEQWQRQQETQRKQNERHTRARDQEAKKTEAAQRTQDAQTTLATLNALLSHTLSVDDVVDWDSLKNLKDFTQPRPQPPTEPPPLPNTPQRDAPQYHTYINLLDLIFTKLRSAKNNASAEQFRQDTVQWQQAKAQREQTIAEQTLAYQQASNQWERQREAYLRQREQENAVIDEKRRQYLSGDPEAIKDYCELVLANSEYPDFFPQVYDLDYLPESSILLIDYQLPALTDIPTLYDVRYIQSRDEFTEKHLPEPKARALYDHVLYQIALRTLHELFEADRADGIQAIVFNGYVKTIDPTSGHETTPCVLSLQVTQETFSQLNLENVDPKACFRSLKGVAAAHLHTLTPIAPVLKLNREDARFIDPQEVLEGVQEGANLATMSWEDFEHFIRELFEREFSVAGGEVKVTRASRDGGVDAVVFDPDPIRGGKIVIQAKRYTNTVGVSAVRDLFGTVMNEGANKGILVTTATYGADAYEFAQGKPIVLLNGSELLHLLEKHGHKARIDLQEARRMAGEY